MHSYHERIPERHLFYNVLAVSIRMLMLFLEDPTISDFGHLKTFLFNFNTPKLGLIICN